MVCSLFVLFLSSFVLFLSCFCLAFSFHQLPLYKQRENGVVLSYLFCHLTYIFNNTLIMPEYIRVFKTYGTNPVFSK